MQITEPARHEAPFFQHSITSDDLERALRYAVRANAISMDNLHQAIRRCMTSLRADGMQCEAALLTMKACVRDCGRRHRNTGGHELTHSDLLMEQIVRWCISEYYHSN